MKSEEEYFDSKVCRCDMFSAINLTRTKTLVSCLFSAASEHMLFDVDYQFSKMIFTLQRRSSGRTQRNIEVHHLKQIKKLKRKTHLLELAWMCGKTVFEPVNCGDVSETARSITIETVNEFTTGDASWNQAMMKVSGCERQSGMFMNVPH